MRQRPPAYRHPSPRLEVPGFRHLRLRRHRRLLVPKATTPLPTSTPPPKASAQDTDTNCGRTYKNLADAVHKGVISEAESTYPSSASSPLACASALRSSRTNAVRLASHSTKSVARAHGPRAREARANRWSSSKTTTTCCRSHRPSRQSPSLARTPPALAALKATTTPSPKTLRSRSTASPAKFRQRKGPLCTGLALRGKQPHRHPRTQFRTAAGSTLEGLQGEYFDNDSLTRAARRHTRRPQIDFDWNSARPYPADFNYRSHSLSVGPEPFRRPRPATIHHGHPGPLQPLQRVPGDYTVSYPDGKDLSHLRSTDDESQHVHATTTPHASSTLSETPQPSSHRNHLLAQGPSLRSGTHPQLGASRRTSPCPGHRRSQTG